MFITLLLSLFLSFFPGILSANVVYTNHTTMDGGMYKLWWKFENSTDTFFFKVEVKAKGWIGFGITQLEYGEDWMRNGMDTYDVVVAGVYGNGTLYSQDYLVINQNMSQYPEHANNQSEWKVTAASEVDSKTTLEFNRKKVTSSPVNTHVKPRRGYIQITPGLRNFVWAYHKTIDTAKLNNTSLKHDSSGLQKVELIPKIEEEREPIYITSKPEVHARRGPASVPVIASVLAFLPFLLVLAFEGR